MADFNQAGFDALYAQVQNHEERLDALDGGHAGPATFTIGEPGAFVAETGGGFIIGCDITADKSVLLKELEIVTKVGTTVVPNSSKKLNHTLSQGVLFRVDGSGTLASGGAMTCYLSYTLDGVARFNGPVVTINVPGPNPAGETLTLTPGAGTIKADWTMDASRTVTNVTAGRNGVDNLGTGPWTNTNVVGSTITFDKLLNNPYEIKVVITYSTGPAVTLTQSATPTTGTNPPAPGTAWCSGPSDGPEGIANWGAFRGEPVKYARTWADTPGSMENLWSMDAVTASGYNEILDLAIGGPSNWAEAAIGNYDGFWRSQCVRARGLFRGLRQLHLSMAHEFNNSYPWVVSAGNQNNFKTAWGRFYDIVQQELVSQGYPTKVILSCNSDSNSGWTVENGMPALSKIDGIGTDYYNFWPAVTNEAEWNNLYMQWKGGSPRGLGAWAQFAEDCGKPLVVPEWGPAPGGDFPTDVPFFIEKMHQTFKAKAPADPYNPGAGKIGGDAYFNAWDRTRLWPTAPVVPNSRAKYLSLSWGTV